MKICKETTILKYNQNPTNPDALEKLTPQYLFCVISHCVIDFIAHSLEQQVKNSL